MVQNGRISDFCGLLLGRLPKFGSRPKNWLQFLFVVKAAVLKQQISKFYPQILSTEDSFYIYDRPLTEINVITTFCALKTEASFCFLFFFCFYNTHMNKTLCYHTGAPQCAISVEILSTAAQLYGKSHSKGLQ